MCNHKLHCKHLVYRCHSKVSLGSVSGLITVSPPPVFLILKSAITCLLVNDRGIRYSSIVNRHHEYSKSLKSKLNNMMNISIILIVHI